MRQGCQTMGIAPKALPMHMYTAMVLHAFQNPSNTQHSACHAHIQPQGVTPGVPRGTGMTKTKHLHATNTHASDDARRNLLSHGAHHNQPPHARPIYSLNTCRTRVWHAAAWHMQSMTHARLDPDTCSMTCTMTQARHDTFSMTHAARHM